MRILVDENVAAGPEAFGTLGDVGVVRGRELTAATVADADALIVRSVTRVDAALLSGTRVRFVGSATAGIDHVDLPWLAAHGVVFAHAPGSNAQAVAEYVVAALLHAAVKRGRRLGEMALGIIGAGHVGARVARIARGLGLRVVENDPPLAETTGDPRYQPIERIWNECDVVSLHPSLTDSGPHATRGMVNAAWLHRLRPGTLLINTSRGEVVDEAALGAGLAQGRPAAVVLDVFAAEPHVDPALVEAAELATPHVAGYSLEGKLAGTLAVYQAMCRWLGKASAWRPPARPRLPLPLSSGPPRPPSAGVDPLELLNVVRRVLDLPAATARFRSALRAAGAGAGPAFDQLRRTWQDRHEFSAYAVSGPVSTPLREALVAMGFDVLGGDHEPAASSA